VLVCIPEYPSALYRDISKIINFLSAHWQSAHRFRKSFCFVEIAFCGHKTNALIQLSTPTRIGS